MLTFEHPLLFLFIFFLPGLYFLGHRTTSKTKDKGRFLPILRLLVIALAVVTLTGPKWQQVTQRVNIFFCLDASDSIPAKEREKGVELIKNIVHKMPNENRAGLVVFGKNALLEYNLQPGRKPGKIRSVVEGNATDIYSALQTATGRFPVNDSNKIVLISDGNENQNKSLDMARLAARLGIEVYPFPLQVQSDQNEITLEKLVTPQYVNLDRNFAIKILIKSNNHAESVIQLFRNGSLVRQTPVQLHPGLNTFQMVDNLENAGLYTYKAIVDATGENNTRNNKGFAFVRATSRTSVLYVAGMNRSDIPVIRILEDHGITITRTSPDLLPTSLSQLLTYHTIVLDDVSNDRMTFRFVNNLESYVRDLGGGLIMLGGNNSFGAGNYSGSAIDRVLPVRLDPQTSMDFPGLCLFLLIDKSSSMSENMGDQPKLEAAKQAAFSSVEILNPIDKIGVLAFDSGYRWIVPITNAAEREIVANRLSRLKGAGGTDLEPALREAIKVIKTVDAVKKHIIVLSDGIADDQDLGDLLADIEKSDITLSTVGVGKNVNVDLLQQIAEKGGGRSYYAESSMQIPRIFVDETKLVVRSGVKEERLKPTISHRHELIGFNIEHDFPSLDGINITYIKPGADTILTTSKGPLLAARQYGLGRSVAFTSDMSGRWSYDWLYWDQLGAFLTRMISWVQKKPSVLNYHFEIEQQSWNAILNLDVYDRNHQFLNDLNLQVTLLAPDKSRMELPLNQVSPGRYSASFPASEIGEYNVSIYDRKRNKISNIQSFGFAIPYSAEYKINQPNLELLKRIAEITGGEVISGSAYPDQLFQPSNKKSGTYESLWPYFLLASILLLVIELFLRAIIKIRLHGRQT